MYKHIQVLTRPESSLQPLWRYLSLERLLQLLAGKYLWFTHLPRLTDGLEGTLTRLTHERLVAYFLAQGSSLADATAEVHEYERHREEFFVNCWHMSRSESYLMWRVYADRGLAVETNFERLQLALDADAAETHGTVVEYRDFAREHLAVGNIFTAVKTKDIPYQDEREFRLLLWQPDEFGRETVQRPLGIKVHVDVRALVERIYVSPRFRGDLTRLRHELSRAGVACDVLSSSVRERPDNSV